MRGSRARSTQPLADAFITPFTQGSHAAARQREANYTVVVQTTIAGLATFLPEP